MPEEIKMTRELADKIMQLGIEGQRVINEKFQIQKDLGLYNWDDVSTAALKFLLEKRYFEEKNNVNT